MPKVIKIRIFMLSCFVILFLTMQTSCGVKGKPVPPNIPPTIGRGEPSFTNAVSDIDLKKKSKKIKDDWVEPKDFPGNETEKGQEK